MARFGGGPMGLAKGLVLVPNNRAARAISDAFVRRSGGGLLLPRLVAVGDEEIEAQIGGALEPLDNEIPPAIPPIERLFALARLVEKHLPGQVDGAEALRLVEELAAPLDQLLIEEVEPGGMRTIAADLPDLSLHWQKSLERLALILDE